MIGLIKPIDLIESLASGRGGVVSPIIFKKG